MNDRRPMQFRITVGPDDAPELFRALSNAKAGRQRVLRFRDLAIQGLLIERLGLQTTASSGAAAVASLVFPQPAVAATATPNLATEAFDSWGAEPEESKAVKRKK